MYKKILVSNLCGVGDLIGMEPIIRVLRNENPNAFIALLTREGRKSVYEKNTCIDEIFVFPTTECNRCLAEGVKGIEVIRDVVYAFIMCLRDIEFDLAVVPPSYTDEIINGLIEARTYCGSFIDEVGVMQFSGSSAKKFKRIISQDMPSEGEGTYTDLVWELCEDCFQGSAYDAMHKDVRYVYGLSDKRFAYEYMKNSIRPHGKERLCIFHVGSQGAWKLWNPERFAELADRCIKSFDTNIFFGGTMIERDGIIQTVIDKMKNKEYAFWHETTLGEYAALIDRADFMVSIDSGPMHIADSLATPLIALFAGEAALYFPQGKNTRLIHKRNMDEIQVEDVFSQIEGVRTTAGKGD